MKKSTLLFVTIFVFFYAQTVLAQCALYPVSLAERISRSSGIVQGTVVEKHSYTDAATGIIYTANKVVATAWLKGKRLEPELVLLTLGGIDGDRAVVVEPSLQVELNRSYLFFLEAENRTIDHKQLRITQPALLQALPFADAQGALLMDHFIYYDLLSEAPQTELELFTKIERLTGSKARRPNGSLFQARQPEQFLRTEGVSSIAGFTPTTVNSGTINPGDFITITGVNFGATRGTGSVAFANADDGGATMITPLVASDYVSWSNTSITVKVPRRAGSGTIRVTDNLGNSYNSAGTLTVTYAHISIESNFLNFASSTRQRYYLRNLNTLGGYTFTYNATFNANTLATASFQRALNTWRCGTGVNFRLAPTTTAIASAASDGVNVVSFDASLPAGTLARATSYFSGSGISVACDLANTVWWASELDMVFNLPPFTGFTWQYGPAAPSSSQFDFQTVALHELGHLHGLGHIVAPGAVMHYAIANGAQNRTLGARDLDAGTDKMSYSTAATCFNPAAAGTPMTAITSSCALPLQWLKFEGIRIDKSKNQLQWATFHEWNVAGFEVERSADGLQFSKLDFIQGKNGPLENQYVYSDTKAGLLPWYYRLQQLDENGRFTYSSTIYIKGESSQSFLLWANESGSSLQVLNTTTEPLQLELFQPNGQQVLSKTITGSSFRLETTHLPRGLYLYRLTGRRKIESGKLVLGH